MAGKSAVLDEIIVMREALHKDSETTRVRPKRFHSLTPRVNTGSRYRCDNSTLRAACWLRQEERGPEIHPRLALCKLPLLTPQARATPQPHERSPHSLVSLARPASPSRLLPHCAFPVHF